MAGPMTVYSKKMCVNLRRFCRPSRQRKNKPEACVAVRLILRTHSLALGLLGVAAQECGHVEIVGGNFGADFADILLDLVDDVGRLRRLLHNVATSLPGLG